MCKERLGATATAETERGGGGEVPADGGRGRPLHLYQRRCIQHGGWMLLSDKQEVVHYMENQIFSVCLTGICV